MDISQLVAGKYACRCSIPADRSPSGFCKCVKTRPDGLDKTAGILLDLNTGQARFFHSIAICKDQVYKEDDPFITRSKVEASGSGNQPLLPKGVSYIYLDQFRRLLKGAKDVTQDDFPMRLELIPAHQLAEACFAEQRQKFLLRKAFRESIDIATLQNYNGISAPLNMTAVNLHKKPKTKLSPAIDEIPSDEDYQPKSSKATSTTAHRRRSASCHVIKTADRDDWKTINPCVLAQFPRKTHLKRHLEAPLTMADSSSNDEMTSGTEASTQQAPRSPPVKKRKRAVSLSTSNTTSVKITIKPRPQKRESVSPDIQLVTPSSSSAIVDSKKPVSTKAAAVTMDTPSNRDFEINDEIPLPQRLRERLTRIGYYTTKQLQASGLRLTVEDMEELATLVDGIKAIEARVGGMDCVERLAVRLRLREKKKSTSS